MHFLLLLLLLCSQPSTHQLGLRIGDLVEGKCSLREPMKGRLVFGFAGGGEGNPPVFLLLRAEERNEKRAGLSYGENVREE